jgi:hypothetical protein
VPLVKYVRELASQTTEYPCPQLVAVLAFDAAALARPFHTHRRHARFRTRTEKQARASGRLLCLAFVQCASAARRFRDARYTLD